MKMKTLLFKLVSLTLTFTTLFAPLAATVGAAPPKDTGQPPDEPVLAVLPTWAQILSEPEPLPLAPTETEGEQIPPPRIETASDAALSRLEPALREIAQTGGDEEVPVLVIAHTAAADLSLYGEVISNRAVEQLDARHVFMRVPARNLVKLASLPSVAAVTGYTSQPRPDLPAFDQADIAVGAIQTRETAPNVPNAPNAITSWFENDYQGVNRTWSVGVYGTGDAGNNIKIGVIDSGVDFCNPALMNRWAVETAAPRWNGWPIAYDDRSAADFMLNYPAPGSGFFGNWGWYVNANNQVLDHSIAVPS